MPPYFLARRSTLSDDIRAPSEPLEHTLEEIGRSFKVSRERIRQIEKKALKRLKHPTRKAALEDFLE